MLVLFGSEGGTAEGVAARIVRDALRRHLRPRIFAMDAYDIAHLIHEPYIVFVCATTGQGDEPANMRRFWRFLLQKQLPLDSLCAAQVAVFGLGDSSYSKFNFVAKKLTKRLVQLGAQQMLDTGLADDQHPLGYDGALIPWLESFWSAFARICPDLSGRPVIPSSTLLPPIFHSELFPPTVSSEKVSSSPVVDPALSAAKYDTLHPFQATVLRNSRMTSADHFQDVRDFEISIAESNIKYRPGDILYLQPRNTAANVQFLLDWLGVAADATLTVKQADPSEGHSLLPAYFISQPTRSIQCILQEYLDIARVPHRYFFELLAFFAKDVREQVRLRELSSAEMQEELYTYCNRQRRTALEVLEDFPSTKHSIPISYLFDLFPALKPRAFSIASSQAVNPSSVRLCVAIVSYQTRISKLRTGVCTAWLAGLVVHDRNISLWLCRFSSGGVTE
eukprot:m.16648 g.16648  ORF g.16648 m.16648 type:complete len:449 (+) comp28546_c0_seq1:1279-2625(+)